MEQNLDPRSERHQDVKVVSEIYVVDDDKHMREILEGSLAAQGFPVKTFEDGDAFLQATTERVPICVFLDVVMPRRSGLEILREFRARRYWTPVFLTSARDDVTSRSRLTPVSCYHGSIMRSRCGCVEWKRGAPRIFRRTRTANGFA